MALDYRKIRKDKEQEYGTKVGNYGRLLANLYSDRAHFIFELLQNAEDALREGGSEWQGSRAVAFNLTKDNLQFNHFGRPFNEADVRGICEIGESAKADDLTAIGHFGIGFKSVYAMTDRPEIHSGWLSYLRWLATRQANEAVEQLLDARAAARRALDEATLEEYRRVERLLGRSAGAEGQ